MSKFILNRLQCFIGYVICVALFGIQYGINNIKEEETIIDAMPGIAVIEGSGKEATLTVTLENGESYETTDTKLIIFQVVNAQEDLLYHINGKGDLHKISYEEADQTASEVD